MKTLRTTSLITLTICLLCSGWALAGNVEKEAGYIDLEWIVIPDDASEVQDIDLGPILAMVRSIRVKAFSVEDGGDDAAMVAVDKITTKLKTNDWKRLIYLKDGDETVSVNTKYDGEDLVGLMIVAYEPGDTVAFINVVGDLDLGTLLSLAKEIDHDSIGDMLEDFEGVEGIEVHRHDDDDDD